MKKILLTTVIAISLISSAFAAPDKINSFVLRSFSNDFDNIKAVEWTQGTDYVKATFVLNNVRTNAFYKLDGDLIGTTHAVRIDDLPLAAKRKFAKKYSDYTVTEVVKFDGTEGSAYFISARNEKQTLVLKASNSGITVFQTSYK